jgi:hypothetical protein
MSVVVASQIVWLRAGRLGNSASAERNTAGAVTDAYTPRSDRARSYKRP